MGQLEGECCISSPHLLSLFLLFLWRFSGKGKAGLWWIQGQ